MTQATKRILNIQQRQQIKLIQLYGFLMLLVNRSEGQTLTIPNFKEANNLFNKRIDFVQDGDSVVLKLVDRAKKETEPL